MLHMCRCGALWMPPTSLDRLDDNINVDASQLEWRPTCAASVVYCAVCPGGYRNTGSELQAQTLADHPEIVVHRCRSCAGMLLDKRTLGQIRSAVIEA